jgi:hypothetical protein
MRALKPTGNQLELKHLAAFAQDLEHANRNRENSNGNLQFVLDANVMWFIQRQLDEEDNNVKDYIATAIGVENAANLIRTSIERLAQGHRGYVMLRSHRYETEVAFASEVPQDYDSLRETLSEIIDEIVSSSGTSSSETSELPRKIILALKENHQIKLRLLIEILSRNQQRRHEIESKTRTLAVPPYTRVPPDLDNTLKKIRFILKEGDNRPTFSASQDVKALRDLAIRNAQDRRERTVLLTFDKRLLQAVRLVQSWNEPWSGYMHVENCQTFWIHHLTQPELIANSPETSLMEIMDDFRLKSRQFLLPSISSDHLQQPLWLTNRETLEALQHKLSVINWDSAPPDDQYKFELSRQISDAHARRQEWDRIAQSDHLDIIRTAGESFFKEVEQMLPSFQLVATDALDPENALEQMLMKHGVQKDAFFQELDKEIEDHAKLSLKILGASSLVAPRTIQAVHRFTEASHGRPNYRKFIHRMPLPIQSDEVTLDHVIDLVSNNQKKVETKYAELIKIGSWKGTIVDLTVAYLLAGSGSWDDAEDICRANLQRVSRTVGADATQRELRLLLAAILRIYKTNSERLTEARSYLDQVREDPAPRSKCDRHDVRLKLEFISIEINRLLIDRYGAAVFSFDQHTEPNREQTAKIVKTLFDLKNEIALIRDIPPVLREKLNANINVNVCLVSHFILRSPRDPVVNDEIQRQTLSEGFHRLTAQTSRISFFEEIIISFAILNRPDLVPHEDFHRLEIEGLLREKLSRVLQRDEKINDFEYWICRDIRRSLNELIH